jgi:nucleotide-binding universal stress UspA family protein
MDEKILVPLDGSELAEVALPYAELAAKFVSEIILVNVTEIAKGAREDTNLIYLQKIAESIKERATGYSGKPRPTPALEVRSVILSGSPAEQIVDYADAENIDLIFMATHGRSGIKRWALGSVADKVVRATAKPVLLIRAKDGQPEVRKGGIFNKVLVPLDGSKEGEAVLPYIAQIASRLNSQVILLQVLARGYGFLGQAVDLTPDQIKSDKAYATTYLNGVGSRLKNKGITVVTEARTSAQAVFKNPSEDILQFADEHRVDTVAMTTHGRSGVGRQVFGSVAERVLREGNTPLLLVRSRGAKVER